MDEQFLILLSAGLVSNLVLDHMLGVDPIIAVSRKIDPAVDLALLMLLVLPVTTTASFVLHSLVLVPYDLAYLQIPGQVLLTSMLVLSTASLTRRLKPSLYARIRLSIPLVLVNGAILGVVLLNNSHDHGLLSSTSFGLGSAIGFGLILLLLSAIREKIAAADVPAPFKGTAILMITLGLMSMAYMGFNGIGSFV